MRYIIMCGGEYEEWETPKHLLKINNESIVERTIRLLREEGITDIAISTNNPKFAHLGVPVLWHNNTYHARGYNDFDGYWCDAFYPTDEEACYIFGDVVFSREAIRKIIEKKTDDIEFFASAPPFAKNYVKEWAEPFALKVVDQNHLKSSIVKTKKLDDTGAFRRRAIMWELWQVIKGTPLNQIDYTNYTAINDWTCDIDKPEEIKLFETIISGVEK